MTAAEGIIRATDAVARGVEALKLVKDLRFDEIARDSVESDEIDNIVVGLYKTGAGFDAWVEVRAVVEKKTGRFFVLIEDQELPFASDLTRAIEAAVVTELRDEFPLSEIRIGNRVVGPSLGP